MAGRAGRASPAHSSSSSGLREPAQRVGRRCPAPLPAHCGWPGAPQPAQEITGAPRGRPARPCSEAAQGGKEAIVGLCCSFPSLARTPGGPWELTKLPPTRSCPASPSPTLGTGPGALGTFGCSGLTRTAWGVQKLPGGTQGSGTIYQYIESS